MTQVESICHKRLQITTLLEQLQWFLHGHTSFFHCSNGKQFFFHRKKGMFPQVGYGFLTKRGMDNIIICDILCSYMLFYSGSSASLLVCIILELLSSLEYFFPMKNKDTDN